MKDEAVKRAVSKSLLEVQAVKLQPDAPFTWASGWKSPIYCDNRVTLSYPEVRKSITGFFMNLIRREFPEAELIAGVATGGIAQAALVADRMDLPMAYVRAKAKGHGLGNQIEGRIRPAQKVVVLEDLISTGGSSLSAVKTLREANVEVLGMVAIFTYGFQIAKNHFAQSKVIYHTLSDYQTLIQIALEQQQLTSEQLESLAEWSRNPDKWRI